MRVGRAGVKVLAPVKDFCIVIEDMLTAVTMELLARFVGGYRCLLYPLVYQKANREWIHESYLGSLLKKTDP